MVRRGRRWGRVSAMAFSPDGERIVAAVGPHNTLRSINAITGREEGAWRAGPDKVVSVAFSPDGKRTASLSGNGTVKLWEAGSAREVASFSAGDASTSIASAVTARRLYVREAAER